MNQKVGHDSSSSHYQHRHPPHDQKDLADSFQREKEPHRVRAESDGPCTTRVCDVDDAPGAEERWDRYAFEKGKDTRPFPWAGMSIPEAQRLAVFKLEEVANSERPTRTLALGCGVTYALSAEYLPANSDRIVCLSSNPRM